MFSWFQKICRKVVPVTIQDGPLLKYLNIRIIQTEEGISIDQSKHIYDNITSKRFNINDERFKTADTPFRTDSAYEKSLVETLPASHDELRELEKEFGGQYNAILGEILHVAMFARFNVAYSCSRYGQYNCAPSKPEFD